MKQQLKIGVVQQSCQEDRQLNIQKSREGIRACAQQGAEVVVLQELHADPYFCQAEDVDKFDLAESIPGDLTHQFGAFAAENKVVLVTSLFEKRAAGLFHNTAVVFEKDGSIAGIYRKMHIPDDPAYYEKFYFTPGDLGFEPIQTSVGKLGVLVCWDQWYPEAARMMAMKGADVLIYPTAIGYELADDEAEKKRQLDAWVTVQRGHAIANSIPVVAVNRVGHEPDWTGVTEGIEFWGNSFVVGPQGEFLAQMPSAKEAFAVATIDLNRLEFVRRIWPFFRDRRIDAYSEIVKRWRD